MVFVVNSAVLHRTLRQNPYTIALSVVKTCFRTEADKLFIFFKVFEAEMVQRQQLVRFYHLVIQCISFL